MSDIRESIQDPQSTISFARLQLDILEEILNNFDWNPQLSSILVETKILDQWRKTKYAVGEISIKHDNEGVFTSFSKRLENNRLRILDEIVNKIEQELILVLDSGDTQQAKEWIKLLDALNGSVIDRYLMRLKQTRLKWLISTDYKDAIKEHDNILNKINNSEFETERIKLTELERVINELKKAYSNLESFDKKTLDDDDISELDKKLTELTGWISELTDLAKPLQTYHSYLPTVFENTRINEALELILAAKEDRNVHSVNYFIYDDIDEEICEFKDNTREEIDPDKAEKICRTRWRKFSLCKYRKYLSDAQSRIDPRNPPYLESPQAIDDELTEKIRGTLLPFSELDDQGDMERLYSSFRKELYSAINRVIQIQKSIGKLESPENDLFDSWRTLPRLEKNIREVAPFLLPRFNQTQSELSERIISVLSNRIDDFKAAFSINLNKVRSESQVVLDKLFGISEFNTQKSDIQSINQLSQKVLTEIEEIREKDPEVAIKEIADLQDEIAQASFSLPSALTELREAMRTAQKPLEQAHNLVKEINTTILEKLEDVDDIDRVKFVNLHTKLSVILAQMNQLSREDNVDLARIQMAIVELERTKNELEIIDAYLLCLSELEKEDADLAQIRKWLDKFKNHPILGQYASDMQRKTEDLERLDNEIRPRIDRLISLLENPNPDIKTFIDTYDDLLPYENRPTTLRIELLDTILRGKNRIQHDLEIFIRKLIQDPGKIDLQNALKYVPRFLQDFPEHELSQNAEGALYEAEALSAESREDWQAAYVSWNKAEDKGQTDAHERGLACLKLWAMEDASKGLFSTLRFRARRESELKGDEDLICWDVWGKLQDIEETYEEPELLENKKETSEFNSIRGGLNVILGRQSEFDSQEKKEDVMAEMVGAEFYSIWYRFGYQTFLDKNQKLQPPESTKIDQHTAYLTGLYTEILKIVNLVHAEAGLYDIYKGKKLVQRLIDEKPWQIESNKMENDPDKFRTICIKYQRYVSNQIMTRSGGT